MRGVNDASEASKWEARAVILSGAMPQAERSRKDPYLKKQATGSRFPTFPDYPISLLTCLLRTAAPPL